MNDTQRMTELVGAVLAGVGAAVVPWVSLTTVFGKLDVSGMEGDGQIVLALAVLAGLAALIGKKGAVVALGLIGGAVMIYE